MKVRDSTTLENSLLAWLGPCWHAQFYVPVKRGDTNSAP